MNKKIRYLIQNRVELIIILLIILFVFIIIQIANYIVKSKKEDTQNSVENTQTVKDIKSLTSAIGKSDKTNTNTMKNNKDLIENFVNYCNSNEVDKAYSMVNDECKSVLYNNSIDLFKENYYNPRFTSKKTYQIQNWTNNIFRVSLVEDLLSTGIDSKNEIQDFISVVNDEGGSKKLNIGNFIASKKLNKETNNNDIKVTILTRYIYMDYEKDMVKVDNNSEFDISLDDLKNTDTIYLEDQSNVKHVSALDKLTAEQLNVKAGGSIQFEIKFTNPYISDRVISNMTFSNVRQINNNNIITLKASF